VTIPSWLQRYGPVALPGASLLFLLLGAVGGSAMDDEEYRNLVVSLVLHARAILDGQYPFWTSDLGLGMPHPLHPTLHFHPLMPLFGVMQPGAALRWVYVLHAVLGAWGMWRLVRHLGVDTWIAGLAASTWVLATPALNYALDDLWLSHFYGWSLLPWMVVFLRQVLDDTRQGQPWRAALKLGLALGLFGVNGHFGQVPILVLPMALMCAAEPRAALRRLPALLTAAAIGSCIAAPVVLRLLQEIRLFPFGLIRYTVEVPLGAHELVDLVLRPLIDIRRDLSVDLGEYGAQTPFFGGPMFLLAVAAIAGARGASRYHQGMAAAFVASFVVLFWPQLLDRELTSGRYGFRDPMSLFGVALGSVALSALARRSMRLAVATAAAQVAVLAVAAWPFVLGAWESSGVERRALRQTPTTTALREWTKRLPGRWYLAPALDDLVRAGGLQDEGLWRDIWVYRGLPVVNGAFKGISTDVLYPSGSLPIGRIHGDAATVQSAETLAVLGMGAVVALVDEPVAPQLEEVARFPVEGHVIRLLRNPAVWPGGALVPVETVAAYLPELPDCRYAGLFCRDFSAVVQGEHDGAVTLTRRHGRLHARFAPADRPRMLLVPEMFRPEWTARSGGRALPVTAAWRGMIAVSVPAGIAEVDLRYRPQLVMALTALSAFVLVGVALTLTVRRARAAAPA
jgi:hypothetical protein